jgi:acetoin utilization deacetylase AcuC-like enzyme
MRRPLVFSPKYHVDYGDHAFATKKFMLAAQALSPHCDLVEPELPERDDLLLAHDEAWVNKVLSGRLSPAELSRLELPFSPAISIAHRLAAGGTVLAARHALENGIGLHAGGGAHHAFRDHGEGYCAVNDIAIAILRLRKERKILRAAVVDLDVHQGNGTASIFAGDKDVFTFSMHQTDIYPEVKQRSTLDVELMPHTGDARYYDLLKKHLRQVMDSKPDLVVYQAGVDVWEKDSLGGLKLTERGIADRDTAVLEACRLYGVPVVVTLGGGYGPTPDDSARLHARTLRIFGGIQQMPDGGI